MNSIVPIHLYFTVHQHQEQVDPQLQLYINVNQYQEHVDSQHQELIKAIKENTRAVNDLKRVMKRNLTQNTPFTIHKVS